jgi:hypothetical protein
MLGRASAAMTVDVYAGLFADNLDDTLVERRRNIAARGDGWSRLGDSNPGPWLPAGCRTTLN